jgi:anti-sigma factor RsiW
VRCQEAASALSAELDGALDADERARLEEHVLTCNDCHATRAELGALDRLLRARPPRLAEAPAALRARLERRLDGGSRGRWIVASLVVGAALGALAVLWLRPSDEALLAGSVEGVFVVDARGHREAARAGRRLRPGDTVETGATSATLAFPRRGRVTLAAESAARLRGRSDVVLEAGRARADIRAQAGAFRIGTKGGDVVVTSAAFEIDEGGATARTSVFVHSGSARAESAGAALVLAAGQDAELEPGRPWRRIEALPIATLPRRAGATPSIPTAEPAPAATPPLAPATGGGPTAGSVRGTVTLGALAPPPADADGVLPCVHDEVEPPPAHVYVHLVSANALPPGLPRPPADPLTVVGCSVTPKLMAVVAGQKLQIATGDGRSHELRIVRSGFERKYATPHQIPLLAQDGLDEPGVYTLYCDDRPSPCGTIIASEDPYFAVTDVSGTFSIGGVPPGTVSVVGWHERAGQTTAQVTVRSGQVTNVALRFAEAHLAALKASDRSCRLALRGDSPIALACAEFGGFQAAKAAMKELVHRARKRGVRYDCADCHVDQVRFDRLSADARQKFERLVAAARP